MQRRFKAIFMAVIMLVLSVVGSGQPFNTVKAAGQIQINIHYHRYASDYDGWNIWSWLPGGDGKRFDFNSEDDFGKVASYTLEVSDTDTQIGFIVRQSTASNDWNLKDTNDDRFIDVSKAKDGVIDIYVVQDSQPFGYEAEEMSLEAKILKAAINDSKSINLAVTTEFDATASDAASKFTLKDTEGNTYPVAGVTSDAGANATSATITFENSLDLLKDYILAFDGYGEINVANNKAFSTQEFEDMYYYDGDDLGATWAQDKTAFRVWAPTASEVVLNLYEKGSGSNLIESIPMNKDVKGTWYLEKTGDLNGVYYTYSVTVKGDTQEAVDPYARAVGVNGDRGMVINLDATDPEGFVEEKRPAFLNPTDAIIYELHVRDFSADSSSGMKNKGKYLAFTETGTTSPSGEKTGIDYLVDLGVTHVHLMPSFDYATVNETTLVNNQFNWGYDPKNYNAPEGSYSTDPHHGEVRVNEFKQMVQSMHSNGIRVVMDVVYNHTATSVGSNFSKIVPGYYYRMNENGTFSNASGCGNETASERAMVRKFIVDSVVYWATEYHVDGFRFDLMGIHDIETMNAVREALNEVDPSIMVYGEGWLASSSTLPVEQQCIKTNMSSLDANIAAFSDNIRDGIKGSVFDSADNGYVTGKLGMEDTIKYGIVAATQHDGIDYSKVLYNDAPWAKAPTQTIIYASAHDNNTLWDKIAITNPDASEADRIKMNLLSSAIILTSQGIPFFTSGEEILRSKPLDETGTTFSDNSYNLSDEVNSIKWDNASKYKDVYNYYKGLIAFRKAHSALRMTTTAEVQENLTFMDGLDANVVGYTINNSPNGETAKSICVIFNANNSATSVTIPEGDWNVYVKGNKAGTEILETISGGTVSVDAISTLVLVQEDEKAEAPSETTETSAPASDSKDNTLIFVIIGAAVVVIGAVVIFVVSRRKKNQK